MTLKELRDIINLLDNKYDDLPVRVPTEWYEPDFVKDVEILYEGIEPDQQMILLTT